MRCARPPDQPKVESARNGRAINRRNDMPIIPTRFAAEFGEVFPFGAFVLGVEASMAFSADPNAPKVQERDKETGQLVWIVRALDANADAAKFGAEFKVKV